MQGGISSEKENNKKTQTTQAKNSISAPRHQLERTKQANAFCQQYTLRYS